MFPVSSSVTSDIKITKPVNLDRIKPFCQGRKEVGGGVLLHKGTKPKFLNVSWMRCFVVFDLFVCLLFSS